LRLRRIGLEDPELPPRSRERPIDLVEEVARVYGLDKVPSRTRATFSAASKADEAYDFHAFDLQDRLAGLGFFEARNLKLISGSATGGRSRDHPSRDEPGPAERIR
jgi:phenylalanyl-tRNA synthetase beta subunit